MDDQVDGGQLSQKLRNFLERKLEESQSNIKKLKTKRKVVKTLYYVTTVLSIVVSTVLVSTSLATTIPPIAIALLSMCGGILTAISTKFNFKVKNNEITIEINKLNNLRGTLDYIISCNGNLDQEKYQEIINKFSHIS